MKETTNCEDRLTDILNRDFRATRHAYATNNFPGQFPPPEKYEKLIHLTKELFKVIFSNFPSENFSLHFIKTFPYLRMIFNPHCENSLGS